MSFLYLRHASAMTPTNYWSHGGSTLDPRRTHAGLKGSNTTDKESVNLSKISRIREILGVKY